MTSHVDDAVEGADNDSRNKKGGPRSRYIICAAIKGKSVILDKIPATSEEDAIVAFEQKHGMKPTNVDLGEGNGYYIAKGTGMGEAQRISVTVTPKQLMSRTTKSFSGEFRGWTVYGSGLKACEVKDVGSFKDNELVSIEFDSLVDSKNDVPKPKLKKREVVRLSDLENVQTM